MIRILVTGANGQLGKSIQKIAPDYSELQLVFKNSKFLDITVSSEIDAILSEQKYDYCINCAAYTNVEKAEEEPNKAFLVNAEAVKNLAEACKRHRVIFIHISTDYVFDGETGIPYLTTDLPKPINIYGASKLKGETYIQEISECYFIVRTSWLYSEFGKNFYKTILQKAKTENIMYITDEQTGCPTRATNLAKYIFDLILSPSTDYGIHHYTDGEAMTWYDFAKMILRDNELHDTIQLHKSENYRTFAQRPKFSVLANM